MFIEAELLNCINCNPALCRNREPSSRGASNKCGLPSADSGLQLDLGDRAKRCLSEDPAPAAYSAVPKDKVKLSDDEIEEAFTRSATVVERYFTRSAVLWAFCPLELLFPVPKTPSASHPHAQHNGFHCDVRRQSSPLACERKGGPEEWI